MTRKRYFWTPEEDEELRRHYKPWIKGKAQQIANRLNVPRWVVNRRASRLGLSRVKEKPWTADDDEYLGRQYHSVPVRNLARYLGRTVVAVKLRAKRLGYRKKGEGYTAHSLAVALGEDSHWVTARIHEGKLTAGRRGTERTAGQGGDYYYITDAAIVEMVRRFPYEIDLRKVDRLWFMDLMASWLKTPNAKSDS